MQEKIDWMLAELSSDGFNLTEKGLRRILDGDDEQFDPAVVDYVDALDKEWSED